MKGLKGITGMVRNRLGSAGKEAPDVDPGRISVGITTFGARFERYFVPLLTRIKEVAPECEMIVAVNGEHQQPFSEDYRRQILETVAAHRSVFPVVFPQFRGLAKLWNSIVIHASHDYILLLNDDIMINGTGFLEDICSAIRRNHGRTFLINQSWSHFLASREELDEIGYFDERLLGIGEEDGDMTWRYIQRYGYPIANVRMKGFVNYAEETVRTYKPVNIQTHSGMKYSLFNRRFIFNEKYGPDPGGIRGMFGEPFSMKDAGERQYPHERFYRSRRREL